MNRFPPVYRWQATHLRRPSHILYRLDPLHSLKAHLQGVEEDLQQVRILGAVHDAVLLARGGAAAAAAVWVWQPRQEICCIPQLADGGQGDVQVLLRATAPVRSVCNTCRLVVTLATSTVVRC